MARFTLRPTAIAASAGIVASTALLLVAACSGGSRTGPTDPGPPPAPILGVWSGSLGVVRDDGSRSSCTLTFHFTQQLTQQQQQAYSGTYTVVCSGSQEDGVVGATLVTDEMSFDAVIRTASSSNPPLDACPWGGQLIEGGARLTGSWAGGGCNGSRILGGTIDISRTGS